MYYKLRYKPTGHIFTLPKEVAINTLNDGGINYEILDKDFVQEQPKTEETSVYKKVVEEDVKKEQPKQKKQGKKSK